MILGTAGHIDHGKTALVRALTGVDTDRLPEEKRRGITIDLGFAPLVMDGGTVIGVVDVPGHEAFVRTMVAGATGIDLALLVIAADEGVMPQTREHLSILSLLGVHGGVVALTKRELVDDEWLALVEEDVRAALVGSALAHAPIVAVSAIRGDGLAELRELLRAAAAGVPSRSGTDLFRLPIDRAFTVKGTGTVVTGTVWSGEAERDASLRLLPADLTVRVRGLHAHGESVNGVHAGERAAIALAGVDLESAGRGSVLVRGAAWKPSRVLRADVCLLPDAELSIGPRTRVRLHLGTSEVGARLVVASEKLALGEVVTARVVLDEPLVARAGDRFVLRAPSPAVTIGGGIVTDPHAPARARPWPECGLAAAERLGLLMLEAGAQGIASEALPVRVGVPAAGARRIVLDARARVIGTRLLHPEIWDALRDAAVLDLARFHAQHSMEPGAPLQSLRARLAPADEVASAVLEELAGERAVAIEAGLVRLTGFTPTLTPAAAALREVLLPVLSAAGAEPPTIDELAVVARADSAAVASVLRWLAREGSVVGVEADRYFSAGALQALTGTLEAGMGEGREYGPAELRELLGLTRKFLIPVLEYCDREGYTIRGELGRRWIGGKRPRPAA